MNFDFELLDKEEVAKRINGLFERNIKIIDLIDEGEINFIFDKLVKDIYGRIKEDIEITYDESKCLLYILYFESVKVLGIDNSNLEMLQFILFDDDMQKEGKCGFCVSDWKNGKIKIYINKKQIVNLCDNKKELIDRDLSLVVVTHELGHAKQFQDSFNGVCSFVNFIVSLEKILDIYTNYNKDNYECKISEIDADLLGMKLFASFMVRHEFFSKNFYEKFCKMYEIEYEQNINNFLNRRVVIDGKSQDDLVATYLMKKGSDLIKLYPMLLSRYPVLKLGYTDNGNLYSISELFKKRLELINDETKEELNKIYEFIIDYSFKVGDVGIKLEEIKLYLGSISYNDEFAEMILLKYNNLYKKDKIMIKKPTMDKKENN